jgi:putative Holliday junction resolvase
VRRLLGVDLGERRIGLAVADVDGLASRPLTTLPRRVSIADDVAALRDVVARESIVELVVGLPLQAWGEEGPQAERTRDWAEAVAEALALPVVYRDERLTSHLAEQRVGPIGRGRSGGPPGRSRRAAHRGRIDREAAAIILQDELEARAARRKPGSGPEQDTEAR